MFQTFTGSSRRPRQVNLSGRSGNPFAAAGPLTAKSAVDSAKEDRIRRQQERDRIAASRRIQRTWRGHSSRRKTFEIWRSIWDESEKDVPPDGSYKSPEISYAQLTRLLLFFSPKNDPQDVQRLRWYGMRQASTADRFDCSDKRWTAAYNRLQQACIEALTIEEAEAGSVKETLGVLAFAARRAGFVDPTDAMQYYTTLTNLRTSEHDALQHALLAPLAFDTAYAGLAVLLARPQAAGMLGLLKDHLDPELLARQLIQTVSSAATARSQIWLLGNILHLCDTRTLSVANLVAQLLGSLTCSVEFESAPVDMDNISFDRDVLAKIETGFPLNEFLAEQLSLLVNQDYIRNMLPREATARSTQLFASLALTLLRCYPRKADDIRMWLYLGPTTASVQTPATQYFWTAMKQCTVFNIIRKDSKSVVGALQTSLAQRDDWIVILLFLELYTFLVKIMDDDQFLGRGANRQSAIPIEDVASLVTFLKNLGFTLCFNISELMEPTSTRNGSSFNSRALSSASAAVDISTATIAGIYGMDIGSLKGLTTGLLRAIYDRDSRRHFLPTGHWLMTSHFDMAAFIPAVVYEEEKRHLVIEEGEDQEVEESDEDDPLVSPGRQTSAYQVQQTRLRAQRRMRERRRLESVAPRLEILQNMPFFIPFTTRVEIFREFVYHDQIRRRGGSADADSWRQLMIMSSPTRNGQLDGLARHHAEIKRKQEFEDAYEKFYDLGAGLKEPIQITFLDEFGLQEAGIDGGGVTKEFLTSVVTGAFDQSKGGMDRYFIENEAHLLFPNPTILDDARLFLSETFKTEAQIKPFLREILRKYEFLGRIIGKCLYEGILVDVSFASFFLKKWALTGGLNSSPGESGYRASINDLRDFDEALYRGLLDVKSAEDASVFDLTFTVDDEIGPADNRQIVERELVPNGSNIAVTNENRLIYINRLSWYRLQGQSAAQTNAFLKGLSTMIQPSWLSMFNQTELQTLIGGANSGIDVADLRRNTQYGGVYVIGDDGLEHPSVQLFWKIMESMSDEERQKVLKFVTSTPRGPLLGFSHLNPRFSIRDSGRDENRFPTTSTCVNLLKLPMYSSEEVMRRKLLDAVNSGAGFDLS